MNSSKVISNYLKALREAEGFSGAALVSKLDNILHKHCVGMAEATNLRPIKPSTIFPIGSITKPITAAAVLQCQEEGLLSLNDRACEYWGCPDSWSKITIMQLLSHTSGIPNFTSLPGFHTISQAPSTPDATLQRVSNLPLEFEPGATFGYSNSGYVLLGLALERVSGRPYSELLAEKIFKPLKMHDTGLSVPESKLHRLADGCGLGADETVDASRRDIRVPYDMSVPYAAGGLYSTVEDLSQFAVALLRSELLPRATVEHMFTPVCAGYALGWMIGCHHGHRTISHSGGIDGFTSYMTCLPDEELVAVVLSNRESGAVERAANDLVSIIRGEAFEFPVRRKTKKVPRDVLLAYSGVYEIRPGFTLSVLEDDGRLYVQALGQPRFLAKSESNLSFYLPAVDAKLCFGYENGLLRLEFSQHNRTYIARKVVP